MRDARDGVSGMSRARDRVEGFGRVFEVGDVEEGFGVGELKGREFGVEA